MVRKILVVDRRWSNTCLFHDTRGALAGLVPSGLFSIIAVVNLRPLLNQNLRHCPGVYFLGQWYFFAGIILIVNDSMPAAG